jgi:hypothetical protein
MERHAPASLLAAVLLTIALLAGCAETVLIQSQPTSAQAYIDDRSVGMTPFEFGVEKGDLQRSYRLRLEKEGYEPYAATIDTRIAGGRMTAAFFTLGIVYLFKSPRYLVQPTVVLMQPSAEGERDRRLGKELREIEELRVEGKIDQAEAERRKRELFDGDE